MLILDALLLFACPTQQDGKTGITFDVARLQEVPRISLLTAGLRRPARRPNKRWLASEPHLKHIYLVEE